MNVKRLIRKVQKEYNTEITVEVTDRSVILTGEMSSWKDIVTVGKLFVDRKSGKHVVNDIKLKNATEEKPYIPQLNDNALDGKRVDVLVIGGGIIGCSILRELSKYKLNLLLVEKHSDVAHGASGANDGMVHAGIDLHKGYLKAVYGPQGNALYEQLCRELDVPFKRTGQYVVFDNSLIKLLAHSYLFKAKSLNIPQVKIISKKETDKVLPDLASYSKGAIYAGTTGAVSPYKLTIAYLENAVQNGAEYSFDTAVLSMEREGDKVLSVTTNRGKIYPEIVINAAGVFADKIAEMADDRYFSIHARRGCDLLLDKKAKIHHESFSSAPNFKTLKQNKNTKGGGIIYTVDGNILLGPNAEETPYREVTATKAEDVNEVFEKQKKCYPHLNRSDIIAYFAGVRAANYEEDFIVERSTQVKNFINAACIQSPGLTAAPAISKKIEEITLEAIREEKNVEKKDSYNPQRKAPPVLCNMTDEERDKLIKSNSDYGKIVCRCEEVSLGEIKDAIHSIVPATTVDAIKRRTRAGMGRCQGGFCMPIVLKTLSEELKVPLQKIRKGDVNSEIALEEIQKIYEDEKV